MDADVKYLLSLAAVRERAELVGEAARAGKLNHFDLQEDKMANVADFVTSVIKRDFGPDKYDTIPPHGRWQHFDAGGVSRMEDLLAGWSENVPDIEVTRRLVDLFFVSVLLDAGAGDHWKWREPETGHIYERSEGIAVASLHMFQGLAFTTNDVPGAPIVDGKALAQLKTETLAEGFQIKQDNPMLGLESRADLLRSLGRSLLHHSDLFGAQGRPGNVVDHMIDTSAGTKVLDVLVLWDVLQTLLMPVWPLDRTTIKGHPVGDAWPLRLLQDRIVSSPGHDAPTETIQPFHKLTLWLTYSLMVPFQRILGLQWSNAESLTALAEYRNGGLFIDLGALSLRKDDLDRGQRASGGPLPFFEASDDVVVEWRAMTLVLVDRLYGMVLSRMDGVHLSMAQLLEAGTWKSGREVAAQKRPQTKSSPVLIGSDGTVF